MSLRNASLSSALFALAVGFIAPSTSNAVLVDVTAPSSPITASSNNSPGSEGVANAIDNNVGTKYLNFDKLNTGFTVMPGTGFSVVQSLTLTSANDAPERDPASYTLEGTNDGIHFAAIASGTVPAFANRFETQTVSFSNNVPYMGYRLLFPTVANAGGANSMQIGEVEILGESIALIDVTAPGDLITASSNNSPGSEGVANAIDNNVGTKYLNFDKLNTGFTVEPDLGPTVVKGLSLTSANDAPERDPSSFLLEGSNDGVLFSLIASGNVPAFTSRFQTQTITFDNDDVFAQYRLTFPTVANAGGANSMQIAEVQLLGTLPPVVPEPATAVLGLLSMGGLMLRRRRNA